jgi:hypothetical protein
MSTRRTGDTHGGITRGARALGGLADGLLVAIGKATAGAGLPEGRGRRQADATAGAQPRSG